MMKCYAGIPISLRDRRHGLMLSQAARRLWRADMVDVIKSIIREEGMDDLARTRLTDLLNTTPAGKTEKQQEIDFGGFRMKWTGPGVVHAVKVEFGKQDGQE